MSQLYQSAGVNLDSGYEAVHRIKTHVKRTFRQGVMSNIGQFGGLFALSGAGQFHDPVLVSGTDGVGTKLLLAHQLERFDTLGADLVAMCVNDVLTLGAKPLFFLDYIASGKLEPDVVEVLVKGICDACIESHCALIGGETAEMPGLYQEGHLDLAGFVVGVAEKENLIHPDRIKAGDKLVGLPSSGLHANGFSLVRKLIDTHSLKLSAPLPKAERPGTDEPEPPTLGDLLLTPTKLYAKALSSSINSVPIHGMAHITGGGFWENIPRIMPQGLTAHIELESFPVPPVIQYLQSQCNLEPEALYSIWNMGIGMVIVLPGKFANELEANLKKKGQESFIIGEVKPSYGPEGALVLHQNGKQRLRAPA